MEYFEIRSHSVKVKLDWPWNRAHIKQTSGVGNLLILRNISYLNQQSILNQYNIHVGKTLALGTTL